MEKTLLWPLLRGEEIKRYRLTTSSLFVLVPYRIGNGLELIPAKELEETSRLTWEYLLANRHILEQRENGRMRHERWYAYIYPKNLDLFPIPKILTPDIAPRASFALDAAGSYSFVSGYGIVLSPNAKFSLEYILALLNSAVLDFYLRNVSTLLRGGFYRYFTQFVGQVPIAKATPQVCHQLTTLARRMLDLHQRLTAKGDVRDSEREVIEREIAQTDRQIDDLVYDLYGLTAKERALVEQEVRR